MQHHIKVSRWINGKTETETAYFPSEMFAGSEGHQYVIGRFITKGSNGTLFRCKGPDGDSLAVKFVHRLDDVCLARFEFETQLLSDLTHPGILGYVDCGDVETTAKRPVPFLVTELCRGNLEGEVNAKGPLPLTDVRSYAIQIADALAYLHGEGVIHRDLKPANFLLTADRIVVGDLGLAKTHTDEGALRFYRGSLTADDGGIIGPINWMSPELIDYQTDKHVRLDHRSDLFQLGLIIWYMATGQTLRGIPDADDDPTGGELHALTTALIHQRPEKRLASAENLKAQLLAWHV